MADPHRLETILAEVAALRDRGEDVDATAILAAHPDLGTPLRDALAALDLLDLSLVGEAATGPHVPEVVGAYRVTSRLGTGGMGTVYLAETRSAVAGCEPGECVALKVVHPHLLERPGFFKRFLREAEAGKRVEHPHVVRTLDADAVRAGGDTVHFLVMEYVEGQTLADLLEDLGVVPETLLREIARQMSDGLAAIHDAGLIHRDLKPENALITPDHVVRLMDLGVARPVSGDDALTQEGAFAGSLPYAAPEQFGDTDVTASADLYSLGVTLYELATGQSPFRRDGFAAVMAAHREHVPPSVREVVPEMSPFFSDVVTTLLAKQPDRRFESADDLVVVLTECERSDWWRERESSRPRETVLPPVPVRRETALHGRDADLALLQDAWAAASAGNGRMVLLEGEAGIGKTRLVDAFLHELGESDVHVLYGSYPPTGGAGGISDAIVEHFGEHGLESSLGRHLTVTPTLVPSIAALVRHQPPPEGAAPLTLASIQAVLVHLMRALAAEKPLVWVVDDLHFADEESRGILLSLARAVAGYRVLLLGTSRPGLPEDWLVHLGRVDEFRRHALARLSAREVIQLLQDAFKSDRLAERLGGRIALKSDGIPFFVFEMIRGLREGQFLTQLPDGTWAETKVVEQIEVPSAVRDLIQARLRGISDDHRAVLDIGAVQGFAFDPDLTARALGRSKIAVLQDLASVERRSGVVRGESGRARFDHHQIQEVLYESLPPDLRSAYHVALAEALESRSSSVDRDLASLDGELCVTLSEHLLKGEEGTRAVRYLEPALSHLHAEYQSERAVGLAERALTLPGILSGTRRASILLLSRRALEYSGRRKQQEEYAREALRLAREAGDEALRCAALIGLGAALGQTSQLEEAEATEREALRVAVALSDRKAEAAAIGGLGMVLHSAGRLGEAIECLERCRDLGRELGDAHVEGRALLNLGGLRWSSGRFAEARSAIQASLTIFREIGDRKAAATATGSLGNVCWSEGRLDVALAHFQDHLAMSGEIGDRQGEANATLWLGNLLFAQGRAAEATEKYERSLALGKEIGDRQNELFNRANLGAALLALGSPSRAREQFDLQLAASLALSDRRAEASAMDGVATALAAEGRLDAAADRHEEAIQLGREIGDVATEAYARFHLGLVLLEQGEAKRAGAELRSGLSLSERIDDRRLAAALHVALGRSIAHGGHGETGHAHLERARDLAAAIGAPGPETLARCGLATRPGGSVTDAVDAFDRNEPHLSRDELREACWLLWRAAGERKHLQEAKRLLDEAVAHVDDETRASMLTNLRVNREIMAAWKEHGADAASESETRAG